MENKKMKILNLYSGIGGNRKLWSNEHKITAVEINPEIAKIYQDFFPNDKVIVADAHQFLLEHYKEFDFIWSSPPCQSHSVTNWFLHSQKVIRYPDMSLYQEIIFLKAFAKKKPKWVIENVKGYYEPLQYAYEVGRHYIWANFIPSNIKLDSIDIGRLNGTTEQRRRNRNNSQIERNAVNPKIGLHLLNCAFKIKQNMVGDFLSPKGESLIAIKYEKET